MAFSDFAQPFTRLQQSVAPLPLFEGDRVQKEKQHLLGAIRQRSAKLYRKEGVLMLQCTFDLLLSAAVPLAPGDELLRARDGRTYRVVSGPESTPSFSPMALSLYRLQHIFPV